MSVNDWYTVFQLGSVIALLLTFAFGTGAIITGLRVNKESSRQVSKLEKEASLAKEETEKIKAKSVADRRESDTKIAEVNQETERIRSSAATAKEDSDEKIARITEKSIELSRQTEALRGDNLRLTSSLEGERAERRKLQIEVSERDIDLTTLRLQLSGFAGTRVLVEYSSEQSEVLSVASQISAGLTWAKWIGPPDKGSPPLDKPPISMQPLSLFRWLLYPHAAEGILVGIPIGEGHEAGIALLRTLKLLPRAGDIRQLINSWVPDTVHVVVGLKEMPRALPAPQE